jgi:polar amino acid transport system substrate-binding protein
MVGTLRFAHPTRSTAQRPGNETEEFMTARDILAPTGRLRAGVFPGSPLSKTRDIATGETHGLCVDLGKELARRLGVAFAPVDFQRIAEVIESMKTGDVDFTISNATPARAADVAFSQTLLSVELGYLVAAHSPIVTIADIDKPGVRVGVTAGSTSQRTLPNLLPNATVLPAQNSSRAIEMLERREIDVFATNKPTLFGMCDRMSGARVMEGCWGVEHIAVAIPRGREAAMEYLRGFVADVQTGGLLAQAVKHAGLRGVVMA